MDSKFTNWKEVFKPMHLILDPNNNKGGLYLGNFEAARDYQELYNKGINSVLTLTTERSVTYPEYINNLVIDIRDEPNENISQYFQKTNQFINKNLQKGNVLVHCLAGVSRSTTAVLAYLIYHHQMTLEEALNYVKQKRQIISPNIGFLKQLEVYESKLKENFNQTNQNM